MGLLQTISYTGAAQTIELPAGTYIFKLFGGRGADRTNIPNRGGAGGYAEGKITFDNPVSLKAYVGEGTAPGIESITAKFNGGGAGQTSAYPSGSGGGATDIRLSAGTLNDRLLVAGGGGGAAHVSKDGIGGKGGGTSGTAGGYGSGGAGATQAAGYAWGNGQPYNSLNGGGGGGWYGGYSAGSRAGGGGGSSYVGETITTQGINFPLIPVVDGNTVAGVNDLGNGWIEIWSADSPLSKAQIFSYTGAMQSTNLKAGRYMVECWGAQGMSYSASYCGGYGGYSRGDIVLEEDTDINIFIGRGGVIQTTGGWNGGGNGNGAMGGSPGGGGGGASDIRIGGTALTDRKIVAGGGGGASSYDGKFYYGAGGGLTGGTGGNSIGGAGGSQTAGGGNGSLGTGGSGTGSFSHGGGGGGYYGGGAGTGNYGGGGGGSSYIGTLENAITAPMVRSGNGQVRITPIEEFILITASRCFAQII